MLILHLFYIHGANRSNLVTIHLESFGRDYLPYPNNDGDSPKIVMEVDGSSWLSILWQTNKWGFSETQSDVLFFLSKRWLNSRSTCPIRNCPRRVHRWNSKQKFSRSSESASFLYLATTYLLQSRQWVCSRE